MLNTHFKLMFSRWQHEIKKQSVTAFSSGHIWIGDQIYKGINLTNKIIDNLNQSNKNELFWIPKSGQFAYVFLKGNNLFAAVDHNRSIPIFYGHSENTFYISDNAHWIREQLNDNKPDNISVEEFSLAGFVTLNNTLLPKIKQLKAGECIRATVQNNKVDIQLYQYYKYLSMDFNDGRINDLVNILDSAMVNSFTRLIKSVDDRTIIIPLSGGLDSRLVVSILKRLDYKNVICFSYGKKGNRESEISSRIAKKLGFQWIFIQYTRSLWKQWFNCNEFKNYFYHFADNLSSVPHIQDWPAVFEMKRKKLIPEDAIFVPGHTGDFIAGGHIPPDFADFTNIAKSYVTDKIIKKHFRVNKFRSASPEIQKSIRMKIESFLPSTPLLLASEAASFYECYDWQERQPKHVLNSLRIYEFFNYDWRIPLWDKEIMDFWCKIPMKHKISKKLYINYLKGTNYYGVYNSLRPVYNPNELQKTEQNKMLVLAIEILRKIVEKKHLLSKWIFDYYRDPYQWYGIYSYSSVLFKKGMFQNIYSFLADTYLKELNNQETHK